MKAIGIVIAAIVILAVSSEIVTLMAIIAGGVGFLGMIAKEAMNK